MSGIKELKSEVLTDDQTTEVLLQIHSMYERAEDPYEFNRKLAEGDIEGAADYSSMDASELWDILTEIRESAEELGTEYPSIDECNKEEFTEA